MDHKYFNKRVLKSTINYYFFRKNLHLLSINCSVPKNQERCMTVTFGAEDNKLYENLFFLQGNIGSNLAGLRSSSIYVIYAQIIIYNSKI